MIECGHLLIVDRTPDVTKEPAWAARKETPTHDTPPWLTVELD
jgi:hypothetical protein